ncbi:hypothetical protein QWJ90_06835 [Microbacterium oryzae]|uniref:hypothetical protein n=1 Tax=Microbacterium oryzae TaxID=743009 RepID=UPI0025AF963E|nr:hypothetical protein [Microbacterium oryzae]MDN3310641.1 hypothetical protein [Microbacterium oryzae]
MRREGLIRVQPYSILDPSLSEVWEVHLTDAPLIEAGTSTAVYEPTDPAPEPGVLYTQSFDMADGTTLPTGWTYRTGAPVTNSFVIASNQLGLNTSSVALHLVQPPTQPAWADHYAEMDVTAIGAAGTYHPVVVVRYNGELSGYLGRYNPTTGAWEIFDLAGGAVLASFVETAPALPYTLRMEADGGTVRLLVNGTEKVSHAPAAPLTATGVALGMRRNNSQAGDNAQRVDNWEHGIV